MIEEYKELKEQVDKVIAYSQYGISNPKTDKMLSAWAENKSWMYESFMRKNLILNLGPISLELDAVDKEENRHIFCETAEHFSYDLAVFINNISLDDFYSNSLSEDYVISADKVIKTGMKVIKAFKYFVEDEETRRYLQDKASELIQGQKIEGDLCISIHPLDFLSSSENTLNWRSCHSLDGEYRAGNLSYIVDNSTFVTYIKTKSDAILPHFPDDVAWNNKKWRCLMFAHNICSSIDFMFAGRQYPFTLPGILDIIKTAITARIKGAPEWTEWSDEKVTELPLKNGDIYHLRDSCFPIGGHLYPSLKLIRNGENSRHFNDLLFSSCYTPYYTWDRRKYWLFAEDTTMTVGGAVDCLYCGEKQITTRDTMMCKECECKYGNSDNDEYSTCDYCGERMHITDKWWIDGLEYCQNCYDNNTFKCKDCGDIHALHNKKR